MPDTLDAATVRRWCADGLAALRRHEHLINQLNVYPVPDGDTGTNLLLTLTAADRALREDQTAAGETAGAALSVMARGALLGARGNSGVILAQLLRGLADAVATAAVVGGPEFADALAAAAKASYAAVAEPVEGTILSVASAGARAAGQAGEELAAVGRAAADAAADALVRTPVQLPVLAAAGVVDAGGYGLVVLLDALVEALTGRPAGHRLPTGPVTNPSTERPGGVAVDGPPVRPGASATGDRAETAGDGGGPAGHGYEVEYLLAADGRAAAGLRTALGRLGDSVVVAGSDHPDGVGADASARRAEQPPGPGGDHAPVWRVHAHVDDAGAAIEAGVAAGRPFQISVTPLRTSSDGQGHRPSAAVPPTWRQPDGADTGSTGGTPTGRAAVVVASGAGLRELFAGEGAVVVADPPSTGEVLTAIRTSGADQVVVLPNDPDTRAVATVAADEAAADGTRVAVVPTRSPVQALAALAVRDQRRRFEDDVIAMAEAAGACRYAEVCRAGRDALTVAGRCRAGDVLALVEGEVHLIGADLTEVCRQLLDRLLGGGGELVSLLLGAEAPPGLADRLTAHLAGRWPFVEVQVHHGGQPHYPLLVGVE